MAAIGADASRSVPLAGQTALVTGASSGIGRACAIALAEAGASIGVNYYDQQEKAEEVVAVIRSKGGDAIALQADVSDEIQVARMFDQLIDRFGTLHILVNNAGIQLDSDIADMTLAQWQRVIEVNLTGQFLCARAAVREFLRRGPQPALSRATGNIICTSSVHQEIPWSGHANYAASKGGVMLLAKSLAQELAPCRIRVNLLVPGAIRTGINRANWESEDALQELLAHIPFGRIGETEDVARAAVWLASDDSDYVTGASLAVDGGMLLYPGFAKP